jgi:hypothetical protein
MAEPMATLKAEGIEVPEGLVVKVLVNTPNLHILVIPLKPTELSDDDLLHLAGADYSGCYYHHKV